MAYLFVLMWSDRIYTPPPSPIAVMDLLWAWHGLVGGRFPHVHKGRHAFAPSTSQTASARKNRKEKIDHGWHWAMALQGHIYQPF